MARNALQFFLQQKMQGKLVNVLCTMRMLRRDDVKEAVDFHRRITDEIGDSSFFAEDNTLKESVLGEGAAVGVYVHHELVALRSISYEKSFVDDAMKDLGFDESERPHMAVMDFCVTNPAFRGNNLQYITYIFMENILYPSRYHLQSTVSPKNVFSLNNILKCGFYCVGFTEKYGGHSRFVFYKNLRRPSRIVTRGHKEILLRDYRHHPTVIAEGYVGYKVKHKADGMVMLYGKLEQAKEKPEEE